MLLSICLPTYNRCGFIRLSVKYWLEQLVPLQDRVELIIADNASTDGTAAFLKSYQAAGPFRLIEREKNLGFNLSVHDLVVRQAGGAYVWVCGDDDYLNPGALARVVHALEAHGDQDHFHIQTQFVPADYAPNVELEDPRTSPHLRGSERSQPEGIVFRTGDIIASSSSDFSGFYSSIWKRSLAIEALSGEFLTRKAFFSLEATLPYAVFIARHRLEKPCYHIAFPALTVVHSVSWPEHASIFRLKIMPELYDLFQKSGVAPGILRKLRVELLDHWPRAYLDLARHRQIAAEQGFSFSGYVARNLFQGRFWKELFRFIWCDVLP